MQLRLQLVELPLGLVEYLRKAICAVGGPGPILPGFVTLKHLVPLGMSSLHRRHSDFLPATWKETVPCVPPISEGVGPRFAITRPPF